MTASLPKEAVEAFACPTCQGQLVLTQERFYFCRHCLLGFRVHGDVPDLGLSRAVSFKKMFAARRGGARALLSVVVGKAINPALIVMPGHCVVVGRVSAEDMDLTVVGRVPSGMAVPSAVVASLPVALDDHSRKLVEKYLSKNAKKTRLPADPVGSTSIVSDFKRDPDFLLEDAAVSRRHALIYQDVEGLWILDLVSKNGSFVNGKEVENQRLKNNDVVSIGSVSLRVSI